MSDLAQRRQELDEDVRRIAQKLQRLRRQGRRHKGIKVTAGQRSTARVLMAMRNGEPTAAMVFLHSKHKGEPTAAAAWVDVEAELHAWWVSADEATGGLRLRKFPTIEPLTTDDMHGKASAEKGHQKNKP